MKTTIRKELIKMRSALTENEVTGKSSKIFQTLVNQGLLDENQTYMVYMNFKNEVMTKNIIDYLIKKDKRIVLPRVNYDTKTLDLFEFSSYGDLEISKYGILEPSSEMKRVTVDEIDTVLVPGVGFNEDGYRIGYGGGFYDKLLASAANVKTIGLAFEMQLSLDLIVEAHDIRLDVIVTEDRMVEIAK